jgi:hypothetical protein
MTLRALRQGGGKEIDRRRARRGESGLRVFGKTKPVRARGARR